MSTGGLVLCPVEAFLRLNILISVYVVLIGVPLRAHPPSPSKGEEWLPRGILARNAYIL